MRSVIWILIILIGFTATAQSQEEGDIWYWAWRSYDLDVEKPEDQRGDLVAFLPNGTVNVILGNVYPVDLKRVNESNAFVGGKVDEAYSLYYLSSDSAIPIMELFDQALLDESRDLAIYQGYSYFIPDVHSMHDGRYLIANTNLNQYATYDPHINENVPLELRAWCDRDCVRVSEDGRYIRYYVRPDDPYYVRLSYHRPFTYPIPRTLPYQLYEYDTVTNTETLVYQQEEIMAEQNRTPPGGNCTPDRFGERWYCTLFLDDDQNSLLMADQKIIVKMDGTIEQVPSEWQLRVWNDEWYFLDLDTNPNGCTDCEVNVFPNGDISNNFAFFIPPSDDYYLSSFNVQLLSEEYLLTNPSGLTLYALSRNGEFTELGIPHCCTDPISMDLYDQRTGYMVTSKDNQTIIWDTRNLMILTAFSEDAIPGVLETFRDYSLVLHELDPLFNIHGMYSYLDQQAYKFNLTDRREFIDAYHGGALFSYEGSNYQSSRMFRSTDDAIYRWEPDSGETILIDGAIAIPDTWN